MKLESLEKLCELAADVCWKGAVLAENRALSASESLALAAIDIGAEVDERYMSLPLDADGVPIRVGDEMECNGEQFTVCAVAPAFIHAWAAGGKLGEDMTTVRYNPKHCTHFKPRTVEDVLEEFGKEIADDGDAHISYDVIGVKAERFAERIRELMKEGGDD